MKKIIFYTACPITFIIYLFLGIVFTLGEFAEKGQDKIDDWVDWSLKNI